MSRKTSKFTIKEADLAEALEVTPQRLDEIIDFFNSDPNDEWDLIENDHFMYISERWKSRIFSSHGAFAIAKYLDAHEKKSLWDKIVEFVTHHREKIRNAFVHKKVCENSSSLTCRNGGYFLSKKDTVAILSTSYARLNKSFEDLKRSERPLEIFVDFDDIDGTRYYSLSGFYRLSQDLSQRLTSKDRRAWCEAVDVAGRKALKAIAAEVESRQQKIQKAMRAAKKRDKNTCQITRQKSTKHNQFDIAAHHVFSSKHYPHLAVSVDNLITLRESVHKEFHAWNRGNDKPCTVDDLIDFVCERYPDKPEVLPKLSQVKNMFPHEPTTTTKRYQPKPKGQLEGGKAA